MCARQCVCETSRETTGCVRHTETIAQFDCMSRPHQGSLSPAYAECSDGPTRTLRSSVSYSFPRTVASHFLDFSLSFQSLLVSIQGLNHVFVICHSVLFICFWCPSYSTGINHLLIVCTCEQNRSDPPDMFFVVTLNLVKKKKAFFFF